MTNLIEIRVVLDTNVWIKVFLHKFIIRPKQPYSDIADALDNGEFRPVYCLDTFNELLHMLTASIDVAKKHGINPVKGGEFVGIVLTKLGEEVTITGDLYVSSDPDDDMFAEAALVGKVDFLVTDDTDLHEKAVTDLLHEAGIRVLWAKEFRKELTRLRHERGEDDDDTRVPEEPPPAA